MKQRVCSGLRLVVAPSMPIQLPVKGDEHRPRGAILRGPDAFSGDVASLRQG